VDKTRRYARLQRTQKEAGRCETSEVIRSCHAQENDAPESNENAAGPSNVELLEEETDREFEDEVSDIEDGCQPGILGSDEVSIVFHAPEGCIRNTGLVEKL
jgi:hypothetical protein